MKAIKWIVAIVTGFILGAIITPRSELSATAIAIFFMVCSALCLTIGIKKKNSLRMVSVALFVPSVIVFGHGQQIKNIPQTYEKGKIALGGGDWDKCIDELQEVFKLDPSYEKVDSLLQFARAEKAKAMKKVDDVMNKIKAENAEHEGSDFEPGEKPKETRNELNDLRAYVNFTGSQFVIRNDDEFDWVNVKMEINPGILRGGYSLETGRIVRGQTYTVGAMQFAKGDGTRFNPFAMKPQSFVITCDRGFWSGGWE
jgi:hypothetical protein